MKTIGVAIVTWPRSIERIQYFKRTMQAMFDNARASRHHLIYFASAERDGVSLNMQRDFYDSVLALFGGQRGDFFQWREGPANLGANMNAALTMRGDPPADYLLLLQDDWVLTQPVDLSPYCDFLDGFPRFSMVRFSWPEVPRHDERAHWIKFASARDQPYGDMTIARDNRTIIRFLDNSSTYLYGDQPHLRRASYLEEFGPFKEGGDAGEPEVELCGRLKQQGWQVATSEKVLFEHCGDVSSMTTHAQRFGGPQT
jgi:hypothetical protein